MGRRFGQVPLKLWRRPAFKALTDEGKLAVLFFWCGPHSTSAGISSVPDGYALADLGWPEAKWKGARLEAEKAGFILRDDVSETVLVQNYLACNRPQNVRHRAAVASAIANIECADLRQMAEAELAQLEATQLPPVKTSQALLETRFMKG